MKLCTIYFLTSELLFMHDFVFEMSSLFLHRISSNFHLSLDVLPSQTLRTMRNTARCHYSLCRLLLLHFPH
jgi:hypothetical protein